MNKNRRKICSGIYITGFLEPPTIILYLTLFIIILRNSETINRFAYLMK